jgi:hypothetical protein
MLPESAAPPVKLTLTISMAPLATSFTKMSGKCPLGSLSTRFEAKLSNATRPPSAEMAGRKLFMLPCVATGLRLTRTVDWADATEQAPATATSRMPIVPNVLPIRFRVFVSTISSSMGLARSNALQSIRGRSAHANKLFRAPVFPHGPQCAVGVGRRAQEDSSIGPTSAACR